MSTASNSIQQKKTKRTSMCLKLKKLLQTRRFYYYVIGTNIFYFLSLNFAWQISLRDGTSSSNSSTIYRNHTLHLRQYHELKDYQTLEEALIDCLFQYLVLFFFFFLWIHSHSDSVEVMNKMKNKKTCIFLFCKRILCAFTFATLTFFLYGVWKLSCKPIAETGTSIAEIEEIKKCELLPDGTIDAVISWVNVTDVKWQQQAKKYACNIDRYLSGNGDLDPFEALRYSLRSVRQNLAFINRIYIITERDQVPQWFVSSTEQEAKVSVVFHDEFMPAAIVPTFNSNPTEMYIHRLKEKGFLRSNCFLYLNDDFIIHQPHVLEDFITSDGRMVFYSFFHWSLPGNIWFDAPYGLWSLKDTLHTHIVDPHVPYTINVDAMNAYLKNCGEKCIKNSLSRCSREGPLPMSSYHHFLATKHSELLDFLPPMSLFFKRLLLGIPGASAWTNEFLLNIFSPSFLYIESHEAVENNQPMKDFITSYLQNSFSILAPWEKPLQ
jgi:hypothetical protein